MTGRTGQDPGIREEAVSPVIGVMLMLSATIIIAATLSAYVGGSTGELKTSPQVNLMVKSGGEGDDFNILFEHHGGDALRTQDLEIHTWVKDSQGAVIKHVQDAQSTPSTINGQEVRVPYIYESQSGINADNSFGSGIWKTGAVAGTGTREATAQFLGVSTTELDELIAKNAVAEIDIVYRPAGNVLYKADIVLEE
ncbi:MAG: type IV pilin N-terminal domain-containing protein [Methanoregula sp.]|jgi:FlaG/FlaF family flagellin (archaellin)|uniref:type IV pilin N-terminal domain-containing protein n=1 Tax=Methanoregula sp. TaxID=2052170 RepID=UPI0025EB732D|nr:type IV pilin N-terminal domain-containing protein [Methanoregula sp.]MCK9630438.1 type IV pilin N-terminal domain-containing protein [Methanoregula sp.]